MMAQPKLQPQSQLKHLHELLKEDQEPFLLETYIASKRNQLIKTLNSAPKTQLQLKKGRPIISPNSNFASKFCKTACFFSSFHDSSPDHHPTRSPLYYYTNFPSPSKSPCKSTPNSIFLHIPAKTSALLLEAALRIHKNSTTKSYANSTKHGIFGSLLKRLTNRSKNQNRDSYHYHHKHHQHVGSLEEKAQQRCPCNSSSSRASTSGVWSEESRVSSRANRCLDTEEEIGLCSDDEFCESPFRFVLQRSSSSSSTSVAGTPEFASPSRHKDTSTDDVDTLKKLQAEQEEEEQFSPVSVLDPPFEDDDEAEEGRGDGDGDRDRDMDGYNYKTSYAIVQRAKENLLRKLSRFEKLAELDPIELEKRMLEDDEDDNISFIEDEVEQPEINMDRLVKQILNSSCYHMNKIPNGMVRLLVDLIKEEDDCDKEIREGETGVRRRVCKRLEAWKEVDSNTIDMMVEEDFKRGLKEWEKNQDQVGETAKEIEVAIFGTLVEEMSQELVSLV